MIGQKVSEKLHSQDTHSAKTILNMPYYNPKPYTANSNRLAKFDLNLSIISYNIGWILFLPNNQGQ